MILSRPFLCWLGLALTFFCGLVSGEDPLIEVDIPDIQAMRSQTTASWWTDPELLRLVPELNVLMEPSIGIPALRSVRLLGYPGGGAWAASFALHADLIAAADAAGAHLAATLGCAEQPAQAGQRRWAGGSGDVRGVLTAQGTHLALGLNREPGSSPVAAGTGYALRMRGDVARWVGLTTSLPFAYEIDVTNDGVAERLQLKQSIGGVPIERTALVGCPERAWFEVAMGFAPEQQTEDLLGLVPALLARLLGANAPTNAVSAFESLLDDTVREAEVAGGIRELLAACGGTWTFTAWPSSGGMGIAFTGPDNPGMHRLIAAWQGAPVSSGMMTLPRLPAWQGQVWRARVVGGRVVVATGEAVLAAWSGASASHALRAQWEAVPPSATLAMISDTASWSGALAAWMSTQKTWSAQSNNPLQARAPGILSLIARHAPVGVLYAQPNAAGTDWVGSGVLPAPAWTGLYGIMAVGLRDELQRSQHEALARDLLRRIHHAQIIAQAALVHDRDRDGRGEFLPLQELAGITDAISAVGQEVPLPEGPQQRKLVPEGVAKGEPSNGYRLKLVLPTLAGNPQRVDIDGSEQHFTAYAIPLVGPGHGYRLLAITEDGVIKAKMFMGDEVLEKNLVDPTWEGKP